MGRGRKSWDGPGSPGNADDWAIRVERDDAFGGLSDRGIKPDTMRRYGYFKGYYGKERQGVHVWPIHDQSGKLVSQRLRLPNKDFLVLKGPGAPSVNECRLFGQTLFGEKNDLRVVITEGEIDAMSVAQATDFKVPAVSINGGAASARKCLQANWRWLDRFKEIILWFDSDAAGQEAIAEAAPLFASGKVKIAQVQGYKDANEVLKANKPGDISQAVYGATTWSPSGIVNAADTEEDVIFKEVASWHFPFPGLQERTRGCRRGETSFWLAGTGVGKTTILFQEFHHFVFGEGHTETPAKIGWLGFEGVRRDVVLGFMSIDQKQRLHLDPLPEPLMRAAHKKVFGTRRFELFDQTTAKWDFDAVLGYIRYMAKALDCTIIMVDPLSFLIAMMPGDDERKQIDRACAELATLAKELNIHIAVNHHLTRVREGKSHEEGGQVSLSQARGSGAIAMFASLAVGFERNQQAETDEQKTLVRVRILKNRFVGWDGVCCYLQYDTESGLTYEIPFEHGKALWGDGKGDFDGPFTDNTGDF